MKYYKLTTQQANIWNLQKYYEGTSISNLCGAVIYDESRDLIALQQAIYTVIDSNESLRLRFAAGKKPKDLTNEDWKIIAEKVSHYAIMSDGQQYSVFIFTLYAEYIDASADWLIGKTIDESVSRIKELSASIRFNTEQLQCGELSEVDYIEGCMWISLEAMIKLLACWLTRKTGPEFAYLTQAVAQLAFEYGRLVLLTREQKLLESYIENQYILDEKLQTEYEDYLEEVNRYSEKFRGLIEKAFSPDIRESLMQSAELAKAAGVKEEELLTSIEDVDDFFLN